jgi:hypothetical protein
MMAAIKGLDGRRADTRLGAFSHWSAERRVSWHHTLAMLLAAGKVVAVPPLAARAVLPEYYSPYSQQNRRADQGDGQPPCSARRASSSEQKSPTSK